MNPRLLLPGLALAALAGIGTAPPTATGPATPGVRSAPTQAPASDRAPTQAQQPAATRTVTPETRRSRGGKGGRSGGYRVASTWHRWQTMPRTAPDRLTAKMKRARRSRRAQGLR